MTTTQREIVGREDRGTDRQEPDHQVETRPEDSERPWLAPTAEAPQGMLPIREEY